MSRYFEKGREPVSSYTHFWGALASAFGTLALAVGTVGALVPFDGGALVKV